MRRRCVSAGESALITPNCALYLRVLHVWTKKVPSICAALEQARTNSKRSMWVHFLSGASAGCYPYTCARCTNAVGLAEVSKPANRGYGIVAADYPGAGLISACIEQNYRIKPERM